MPAFAESLGLPYVDLEDISLDQSLIPRVPAVLARQHSLVPVMVDDGQLLVASPNPIDPNVEEELRLRLGMPVRSVICTPAKVNEMVGRHYSREAAVAEMAAAKGKTILPGAVPGSPADAAKPAAAQPTPTAAAPPLSRAEAAKRGRNFAIIAFNITMMVGMIALFVIPRQKAFLFAFSVSLLAGLVVSGITYLVVSSKR
jgi:hypothetical protein